jgi:hypothetical protein
MRRNLAAMVTACFAVAVSTPPVGLVVHHHAGGELPHVHAGLGDDPAHDAPDLDDEDHDHDGHDPAPGLHVARTALEWHTHATSPFHRAGPAQRTDISCPHRVARLNVATPPVRATPPAVPSRSRAATWQTGLRTRTTP